VARLQAKGIKISWPGTKHCYDKILVEWLWRAVKHQEAQLHDYSGSWDVEISLARFL
jgi:hypothetical protein